eukprot:TRINITY_DN34076_c0_g1_i1.p1 TRINITY_DN34076_c0_g1~~TRINITY_DN34076_c0_g1_i1.p1  ORF type:complete len:553 (+),score=82.01 TRINITY_DN34076_c0_g1_i1:64-1722(+)
MIQRVRLLLRTAAFVSRNNTDLNVQFLAPDSKINRPQGVQLLLDVRDNGMKMDARAIQQAAIAVLIENNDLWDTRCREAVDFACLLFARDDYVAKGNIQRYALFCKCISSRKNMLTRKIYTPTVRKLMLRVVKDLQIIPGEHLTSLLEVLLTISAEPDDPILLALLRRHTIQGPDVMFSAQVALYKKLGVPVSCLLDIAEAIPDGDLTWNALVGVVGVSGLEKSARAAALYKRMFSIVRDLTGTTGRVPPNYVKKYFNGLPLRDILNLGQQLSKGYAVCTPKPEHTPMEAITVLLEAVVRDPSNSFELVNGGHAEICQLYSSHCHPSIHNIVLKFLSKRSMHESPYDVVHIGKGLLVIASKSSGKHKVEALNLARWYLDRLRSKDLKMVQRGNGIAHLIENIAKMGLTEEYHHLVTEGFSLIVGNVMNSVLVRVTNTLLTAGFHAVDEALPSLLDQGVLATYSIAKLLELLYVLLKLPSTPIDELLKVTHRFTVLLQQRRGGLINANALDQLQQDFAEQSIVVNELDEAILRWKKEGSSPPLDSRFSFPSKG